MILHTWATVKFFLGLIQRLQHSFSQVFVFADHCVTIPDVHHFLDNTHILIPHLLLCSLNIQRQQSKSDMLIILTSGGAGRGMGFSAR